MPLRRPSLREVARVAGLLRPLAREDERRNTCRSRDRRRGSSRSGRGGLCRFRRAEDDRPGKLCARRTSRSLIADRELFRFSHRHQRRRADLQRAASGLSFRREVFHAFAGAHTRLYTDGEHPRFLQAEGCNAILRAKCVIIATGADYHRLEAERREEFEGSGVYYAATAREGQLCRGCDGDRRRRRQLRRAGSDVSFRRRCESAARDPRRRSGEEHVELSFAPRRDKGEHRNSAAHRDPANDRPRKFLEAVELENTRTQRAAHSADTGRLFHDRRKAVHRLAAAARSSATKRASSKPASSSRRKPAWRKCRSRAGPDGNEPTRHLRRGRRALRFGQTLRRRGGRRRHGGYKCSPRSRVVQNSLGPNE